VAVEGVQFLLDGLPVGDEDVEPPYALNWNTTSATDGLHSLSAAARDPSGNAGTSSAITVTIRNSDVSPPLVVLTSPSDGAIVGGIVTLAADASDNRGVTRLQFFLDGAPLGDEDVAEPFVLGWDSVPATNGAHTIQAVAYDAAGNSASSGLATIIVDNTGTPSPSIRLIAPAEGSIVFGIVSIEAAASVDLDLASLQFL